MGELAFQSIVHQHLLLFQARCGDIREQRIKDNGTEKSHVRPV
jgi:hypothetical protein